MSGHRCLEWFGRFVLGGTFVAAGLPKVLDPVEFALSIHQFRVLPEAFVAPTAILLPWFEMVAGAALLGPRRYREAATVVLLTLLLGFTAAMLWNQARGLEVPCGCFGGWWEQLQTWPSSVLRNSILIVIAVFVFLRAGAEAATALKVGLEDGDHDASTRPKPARVPCRSDLLEIA